MTLSAEPVRRKKRGGLVVLAVVALGVAAVTWFVWEEGAPTSKIPSKEQVTRPGGTKWLVSSEPLRTAQGFEVIPLTAEDMKAAPRLSDLVRSGSRSTVILSAAEHDELRDYLAAKLPAGWDDPFGYGVAWRYETAYVHLSASPADVI